MPKDTPILFTGEMVRSILDGRKAQTRRILKVQPLPPVTRWIMHDHWWVPKGVNDAVQQQFISTWPNALKCPYGQPGDRMWVRETFAFARHSTDCATGSEYSVYRWEKDLYGPYDPEYLYINPRGAANAAALFYKADGEDELPAEFSMPDGNEIGWTPSIHMPKWACRLWLELTDVRVERLQEISQADAIAEGAPPSHPSIDLVSRDFGYPDFSRSWYAQLWESINGEGSWAANPWVWVLTFERVER